jgi:flagellar hook protein FlgE
MSLSGALNTAVSGLQAQSKALGIISDNVANSQTTGYKKVDSRFTTLVSVSNARTHEPGGVVATPFRATDLQGTITSTSQVTNLALSGSGFFSVSKQNGEANGNPTFENDPYFTRAGDFTLDKDGYLVNTGGYYLNGWTATEENNQLIVDRTTLQPIQISQLRDAPSATTTIDYSANLPANITSDDDVTKVAVTAPPKGVSKIGDLIDLSPTQVKIYDALGSAHTLNYAWSHPTTVTTDAAGNTTTVLGELGSDGGKPYINTNVWYATASGSDFSFAPTMLNNNTTNLSVSGIRYRYEFYGEDDAAAGVSAGSIKSVTEMQNYAAQSVLANALKVASFNGAFQDVGDGADLETTNSALADGQFILDSYDASTGEITVRLSNITASGAVADGLDESYVDKIYRGKIPLNSSGEVNGPVTLINVGTETGTVDDVTGAKAITSSTTTGNSQDAFSINLPDRLASSDVTSVLNTMLGADSTAADQDVVNGNLAGITSDDALGVRMGQTVTTYAAGAAPAGAGAGEGLDITGLIAGQTLSFDATIGGTTTTFSVTVPTTISTATLQSAVDAVVGAGNLSVDLTGNTLSFAGTAAADSVTFATAASPSAFTAGSFKVTSYNATSGEITVQAGGRTYTGTFGGGTAGSNEVRLVDTADSSLSFTQQRSLVVTFQGATTGVAWGGDNSTDNILTSSTGIPTTAYDKVLQAFALDATYSGSGATMSSGTTPLSVHGTTVPDNVTAGGIDVTSIDSDGRVTMTIGDTVYTGMLPLNSEGRINYTVDAAGNVTVDPVALTSADGTKSFLLHFDEPWDIDGVDITATVGSEVKLPINVVFANSGSDLTEGVLPDEARQTINMSFGNYGKSTGLTQYAGTEIDFLRTNQDGVPPGSFRELTIDELGYVTINYDNGRKKTVDQIPVAVFDNPNALQLTQGNAYKSTFDSGEAAYTNPGGSGAATISASSLEGSNVDIADEFSKLIVTQRSYSANARIVTTSDSMLEETVNLVR